MLAGPQLCTLLGVVVGILFTGHVPFNDDNDDDDDDNNNLIYKAPYGCNLRGAGAWWTGLVTCLFKCLIKHVSL